MITSRRRVTIMPIAMMALAEVVAPAPQLIVKPDWVQRPTGADLAKYYPKDAAKAGLGGSATIQCHVTAKGGLDLCKTISEAPLGAGFGDAAIKMSGIFRMKPQTADGQPTDGGSIVIPIVFRVPQNGPAAPVLLPVDEALGCYGAYSARANANPADQAAWIRSITFMLMVAMDTARVGRKPGDMEASLAASRQATPSDQILKVCEAAVPTNLAAMPVRPIPPSP
jgi:TonB family protein